MPRLFPLAALLPTAAFAHPGAHLHPHGADISLTLLVATGVAAAAWLLLRRRP